MDSDQKMDKKLQTLCTNIVMEANVKELMEANVKELMEAKEKYKLEFSKLDGKFESCLMMMDMKDRKLSEAMLSNQQLKGELEIELRNVQAAFLKTTEKMQKNIDEFLNQENRPQVEPALQNQLVQLKDKINLKISKLEKEIGNLKQLVKNENTEIIRISQVPTNILQREYPNKAPDFVWKIMDPQNNRKSSSMVFAIPGYAFEALASYKIEENESMSVTFMLLNKKSEQEKFTAIIFPRVYIILKDVSGNEECRHVIRTASPTFKLTREMPFFYDDVIFSGLKLSDPTYSFEDSIFLEFYVASQEMERHRFSSNGILLWSVENYQTKKKMEREGLVLYYVSPSFNTIFGLRLQAFIFLNGYGDFKDQGLTVGLQFQNSLTNHVLRMLTYNKITVTIYKPSNSSINITKSFKILLSGTDMFFINIASHEVIESILVHDVLFYKVSIEEL